MASITYRIAVAASQKCEPVHTLASTVTSKKSNFSIDHQSQRLAVRNTDTFVRGQDEVSSMRLE